MLKQRVSAAENSIRQRFEGYIDTAIILGSGLSGLALSEFKSLTLLDYADIEGLPRATAPSHLGTINIVTNGEANIAICSGRHHLYEGYSAEEVTTLTYLMSALGANHLVVTNAAGALNPNFKPGDVMLINDHINFTGTNPLIGQDNHFGITFPDMSRAYCPDTNLKMQQIAKSRHINLKHGVYIGVSGPSLETSAERRMFRTIGADAVGMSTVLEVIAANHASMKVTGLSAITNLALGDKNQQPDTIEAVLANAAIAGEKIKILWENLFNN
ncbi:MAG: purine-nucleoside phosphorylase [Gammaproteobacteria bacterium]|nr:purine-nucleoside phosphorylase [Gammaproteobacteria bacterium]